MHGEFREDDRDAKLQKTFSTLVKPKAALVSYLDDVIDEADNTKGRDRETNKHAIARKGYGRTEVTTEIAQQHGDHDENATHRRRTSFNGVRFGSVIANMLPYLSFGKPAN